MRRNLQSMRNNLRQNFEERQKMYLSSLSHSCYYDVDGIGATPLIHLCVRDSGGLFHCGVTTNFIFIITIHISMGGSPGDVSEEPVNEQSSFSKFSVISPTPQLILQAFRHFTYVTAHFPTLPLLHLRHNSFSNPSFASPSSQALHLRHLASAHAYFLR